MSINLILTSCTDNILQISLTFRFIGINIKPIRSMQNATLLHRCIYMRRINMMACCRNETEMLNKLYMEKRAWNQSKHNKEQITSRHHMHMAHGLVGTIKTSLNVEIVSTSVKQQHHCTMFASSE